MLDTRMYEQPGQTRRIIRVGGGVGEGGLCLSEPDSLTPGPH